jgi:phosphohistidine phosphatase
MKVYLVRHGIAHDRIGGAIQNDFQRPLTEEGKKETHMVALALQKLDVQPDVIVTSPLIRAEQTAKILQEVLSSTQELAVTEALAPGGTTGAIFKFLEKFAQVQEICLVGHEPDIGRLAGQLLWCGPDFDMRFKKAGVCRIDLADLPPTSPGTLKWFITPKIMASFR